MECFEIVNPSGPQELNFFVETRFTTFDFVVEQFVGFWPFGFANISWNALMDPGRGLHALVTTKFNIELFCKDDEDWNIY